MTPHLLFLIFCAASSVVFCRPLVALAALAIHDDRYTVALAIPFLSLAMAWIERKRIFSGVTRSPGAGSALMLFGLGLFAISELTLGHVPADSSLSIRIFALVALWVGAFVCSYGTRTARRAMFPLFFLLLMVPVPAAILSHVVVVLQAGSAEVSYRLFRLAGVPVLRDGIYQFSLPGVTIVVAEECSGIRSNLSLFISSLAAGYVLLRSRWSRTVFSLMTIPVAIFKNAVRIVTISLLGVYVDPGFLHGRLHRQGGLPFSALALVLLAPLLIALIRIERRRSRRATKQNTLGTDLQVLPVVGMKDD